MKHAAGCQKEPWDGQFSAISVPPVGPGAQDFTIRHSASTATFSSSTGAAVPELRGVSYTKERQFVQKRPLEVTTKQRSVVPPLSGR